ncbi:hypothetical protein [Brachybacterium epidermidis]|uniref:hypothetical protein n=1 Tax=Brachybacterium epidermidis TaxID=2781983 RepID=UPI00398F1615
MTPTATLAISIASALFALAGVAVGIIGLVQSSRAHRVAKAAADAAEAANRISEESNGIAREANQISRTATQQAHERHDVRWDADFGGEGVLVVKNLGRDTAYNVLIRVAFKGGEPQEVEAAEVARHDEVQIDLPAVREQLEKDRQEDAMPIPGILIAGSAMRMYRIDIEATWQSESGRAYRDDEIGGTWSSLEP